MCLKCVLNAFEMSIVYIVEACQWGISVTLETDKNIFLFYLSVIQNPLIVLEDHLFQHLTAVLVSSSIQLCHSSVDSAHLL